jgi:hypothetical protein
MPPIGRSRVLDVPYLPQPTPVTCQSTCLSMMAAFIEQQILFQSTGAGDRDIVAIWKDVNESPARPVKVKNAHANLKWWLEQRFPTLRFEYLVLHDEAATTEQIVRFIDGGMPVLVSVSHARVAGHIVLVTGYENYLPNQSSVDFKLVVHDPYGQFDPTLLSKTFGKHRFDGGMSLQSGGAIGPGRAVRVPVASVGRQRAADAQRGTFYLLSGRR